MKDLLSIVAELERVTEDSSWFKLFLVMKDLLSIVSAVGNSCFKLLLTMIYYIQKV